MLAARNSGPGDAPAAAPAIAPGAAPAALAGTRTRSISIDAWPGARDDVLVGAVEWRQLCGRIVERELDDELVERARRRQPHVRARQRLGERVGGQLAGGQRRFGVDLGGHHLAQRHRDLAAELAALGIEPHEPRRRLALGGDLDAQQLAHRAVDLDGLAGLGLAVHVQRRGLRRRPGDIVERVATSVQPGLAAPDRLGSQDRPGERDGVGVDLAPGRVAHGRHPRRQ
ncbi:MAG TPA: hypothetical protein VH165_02185 [Kofleriaceae bacterium]|nr:hypothetical protein [Kofleriaceae bacterium]